MPDAHGERVFTIPTACSYASSCSAGAMTKVKDFAVTGRKIVCVGRNYVYVYALSLSTEREGEGGGGVCHIEPSALSAMPP